MTARRRPRRSDGPRPIGDFLPDAIRAINPDDPRLEAIATGLEEGRTADEILEGLGLAEGPDPEAA